ncbi:MAG: gliding motility-associated protein GldE [Flavobacteriales bacterium]|nr:gliding motility-associated protein GldE [Flavobacteriales bacterium]
MISGAEVAFFSLTPQIRKSLEEDPGKRGRTILQLLDRPKRLLATILVANNLFNVAAIILSSFVTANVFHFQGDKVLAMLVEVVFITFLLVLIGEILPKVYATKHALPMASLMAFPLFVMERIFRPISLFMITLTSVFDKRIKQKSTELSMDDLSHALELTTDEATTEEEQKMLSGIVKFGNIDVKQIMKSRVDVVSLNDTADFDEVLKVIIDAGYSRIPVFHEHFDHIGGVLYVKDLLPYIDKGKSFNWQALIRKPFFVPESKKIDDLLKEFQKSRIHLAIVVDEYGGTLGIVTLEDIIEEIVGEISDEFDEEELVYSKLDDHNFIFEGKILLKDFCRVTGLEEGTFDGSAAESLGGIILEQEGKIPDKNAVVVYKNLEFKIEAVDTRRIIRVKVTILQEEEKNKENED